MRLHLGQFDDFKFGQMLLLSGGSAEMGELASLLSEFVASGSDAIAVHHQVVVSPSHPAKLFAVASPDVSVDGHAWLCNPETLPEISGKLTSLGSGHRYFELMDTSVELLVSVGEYDLAWWRAQV